MSLSTFIKENRVLIAGALMPLLLVGFFALAKMIPHYTVAPTVAPPLYKALYTSSAWNNDSSEIRVVVNSKNQLDIDFRKGEKSYSKAYVYLYDPKTNKVDTTEISLADDDTAPALKKFETLTLSTQQPAPDGYVWTDYRARDESIATWIFTNGTSRDGPFLVKNNNVIKIGNFPTENYISYRFLGWVLAEGHEK